MVVVVLVAVVVVVMVVILWSTARVPVVCAVACFLPHTKEKSQMREYIPISVGYVLGVDGVAQIPPLLYIVLKGVASR